MTGPRIDVGPGGFRWNAEAGRYIGPGGQFVAREKIRSALDQAIRRGQLRVRDLSNQLRTGSVSLDTWWQEMRTAVKDANLYSAAAARGGWAQMTAADYGAVGAAVKKQYAYLDRFVGELDAGGVALDGRFLRRAMSYLDSGRVMYERVTETMDEDRGMTEERNLLGVAEHCADCLGETARGWVPIGELIPIGDRICRNHCRCKIQRRRGAELPAD